MTQLRQDAMFLNGPGTLILGGDIDDTYLRIDYLARDYESFRHVLMAAMAFVIVSRASSVQAS